MTEFHVTPQTIDDPIDAKPGDVIVLAPGIYVSASNGWTNLEVFGETRVKIKGTPADKE